MTSVKTRGPRRGVLHIDKRAARLLKEEVSRGPSDELLNTKEVADWLCLSVEWVELSRFSGTGPKHQTLPGRRVRYRRGDVRDWLKIRSEHART
jgi:hypothetical protein